MASDDIFIQIYERYYKLMYQVAYSILQNFEDTEDVLQEAFIRIDKNISNISEPFCSKTKNFVVIITKRLALNMLRKKKGIQVEELLATLEDVRIEASPERANETKTIQELVKMAIRDLPERYQDCLFLMNIHQRKLLIC